MHHDEIAMKNHEDEDEDDLVLIIQHMLEQVLLMHVVELLDETDHLIHSRRGEHDEDEDDSELRDDETEVNEVLEQSNDEMVECDDDLLHEQVEQGDNDEIRIVRLTEHQVDTIHEIEVKVDSLYAELEVLDDQHDVDDVLVQTVEEIDETLFTEHEVLEVIETMHIDVFIVASVLLTEVTDECQYLVTEVMVEYEDAEVVKIMQLLSE